MSTNVMAVVFSVRKHGIHSGLVWALFVKVSGATDEDAWVVHQWKKEPTKEAVDAATFCVKQTMRFAFHQLPRFVPLFPTQQEESPNNAG